MNYFLRVSKIPSVAVLTALSNFPDKQKAYCSPHHIPLSKVSRPIFPSPSTSNFQSLQPLGSLAMNGSTPFPSTRGNPNSTRNQTGPYGQHETAQHFTNPSMMYPPPPFPPPEPIPSIVKSQYSDDVHMAQHSLPHHLSSIVSKSHIPPECLGLQTNNQDLQCIRIHKNINEHKENYTHRTETIRNNSAVIKTTFDDCAFDPDETYRNVIDNLNLNSSSRIQDLPNISTKERSGGNPIMSDLKKFETNPNYIRDWYKSKGGSETHPLLTPLADDMIAKRISTLKFIFYPTLNLIKQRFTSTEDVSGVVDLTKDDDEKMIGTAIKTSSIANAHQDGNSDVDRSITGFLGVNSTSITDYNSRAYAEITTPPPTSSSIHSVVVSNKFVLGRNNVAGVYHRAGDTIISGEGTSIPDFIMKLIVDAPSGSNYFEGGLVSSVKKKEVVKKTKMKTKKKVKSTRTASAVMKPQGLTGKVCKSCSQFALNGNFGFCAQHRGPLQHVPNPRPPQPLNQPVSALNQPVSAPNLFVVKKKEDALEKKKDVLKKKKGVLKKQQWYHCDQEGCNHKAKYGEALEQLGSAILRCRHKQRSL